MKKDIEPEDYTRRNSLRLAGFDYAARRLYFVTIVTAERRQVFLDSKLAKATLECLSQLRATMRFALFSYCLMPDHFHGIIGLGESGKTLGEVCGAFKSVSTRAPTGVGTKVSSGKDSFSIMSFAMKTTSAKRCRISN